MGDRLCIVCGFPTADKRLWKCEACSYFGDKAWGDTLNRNLDWGDTKLASIPDLLPGWEPNRYDHEPHLGGLTESDLDAA